MERPKVARQEIERHVTGEVAYYQERLDQGEQITNYQNLNKEEKLNYEAITRKYQVGGIRPTILDKYEEYDDQPSEVVASCLELADILLAQRTKDSSLSFEDMAIAMPGSDVRARVEAMPAASILSGEDEQLAIHSNGEHYPILDVKKKDARLRGVGLRIWGWDYPKSTRTNTEEELYEYKKHYLPYLSDEKDRIRELEISFSYSHPQEDTVNESLTLRISSSGSATIGSSCWMSAYAETGYEGHRFKQFRDCTDEDVALFGDLVAEMVGDEPETVANRKDRLLQELIDGIVSDDVRSLVVKLQGMIPPHHFPYLFAGRTANGKSLRVCVQDEACTAESLELLQMVYDRIENDAQ